MSRILISCAVAPMLGLVLAACDNGATEPAVDGSVVVRFAGPVGTEGGQSADLKIDGFNGLLTLTDVRIVVDDFELKRENEIADCSATARNDLCADIDIGPAVVDLPLSAGVVTLGQETVAGAEYEEIEFDVVNLEGSAAGLLTQLRALPGYADWPANASVGARGTFLDKQSGQTRPFTVYFDVDAEVELEFRGNRLDVGDGGTGTVTIHVDPTVWLAIQGGVVDLSAFDYHTTGQVASLSFPFQSGLEVVVQD